MADALGPYGLTVTQFAVLTGLEEEPGLSNADLARRAFVTPQSMHAVLQELESRQFLVRRPHPQHRRVLQAELTEGGRGTLEEAADAVDAVEERMLGKLSEPGAVETRRSTLVLCRRADRSPAIFRRSPSPVTRKNRQKCA